MIVMSEQEVLQMRGVGTKYVSAFVMWTNDAAAIDKWCRGRRAYQQRIRVSAYRNIGLDWADQREVATNIDWISKLTNSERKRAIYAALHEGIAHQRRKSLSLVLFEDVADAALFRLFFG